MKPWLNSRILILLVGMLPLGVGCTATSTPTTADDEDSPGADLLFDDYLADAGGDGTASETVAFELLVGIDGSGTVSPLDTGPFDQDTEVTLAVQASEGWIFDHWEGDVSGDDPLVILLMDGPKNVIAVFVEQPEQKLLEVVVEGNGRVRLYPTGSEVENGWQYDVATEVVLYATPDVDWVFTEWSGAVESSESSIIIVLEEDVSATATFEFLAGDKLSFLTIFQTQEFDILNLNSWAEVLVLASEAFDNINTDVIIYYPDPTQFLNDLIQGIYQTYLTDMMRESTWANLGIVLGEPLQLTQEQIDEVNTWNETTYPDY